MIKPAMNKHLPFTIRTITLCAVLATLLPCVSALAAPPPYGQSIGGTVFCDFNRDGIQETGEPGLAGVKVTLTGVNVTATAFTDANGNYLFDELKTGKYTVTVDPTTAPPGCNIILPNCPLSFKGTLHRGQALLGVDFCFGTNGTIGDTVFCDLNGDGMQENGEPGLEGVKVTLTGNGMTQTEFTNSTGTYLFTGLPPGTYTVTVDPTTAPPGCNIILQNCPLTIIVPLALGQMYNQADFCFGPAGSIGDTVFCDLNRDGIQEPGEPGLQGVKVTLTGDNGVTETAVTDANGNYLFSDLGPANYTVTVDPTTAPPGCNVILPNCPLTRTVDLALGENFLDADFCFGQLGCVDGVIGGVNLNGLANKYLFFFGNGSVDANWQGATKGFAGDVLVDGIAASERTSGGVPYAGTIVTNDSTLSAWQSIVDQNPGQAFSSFGNTTEVSDAKTTLVNAIKMINALPATPGYTSVSSTSLNNLNTQNGVAETFVINVTSGFQVTSEINITGDAGDVFILRWDTDANPANGYQGQVKFQSGGAIVPHGGLASSNFIHVAGDLNASGGGGNPPAPYPQGPRSNNGTGNLINGGADWGGGGFFTGYWLTTGMPTTLDPVTGLYTGNTSPFSNAIFVGGWYTCTNKFSMTSGTSGVYVAPNCP